MPLDVHKVLSGTRVRLHDRGGLRKEVPPSPLARAGRILRRPPFLIFIILFMTTGATLVGFMNSMDGSQYALTRAIGDDQTIRIEKYDRNFYPDYSIGRDGILVSDREPGPSVLAVPFYLLGHTIDPLMRPPYDGDRSGLSSTAKVEIATYLSLVFVTSLGLAYAYVLLRRLGVSQTGAVVTCLLTGFGTLMFRYSASFSRQPAVGMFLALTVLQALTYAADKKRSSIVLIALFGCLAVSYDYMAALPLLLVGLVFVAIERPSPSRLRPAAVVIVPFAVLLLAYNYFAFGQFVTSPHVHEARFLFQNELRDNFRTPIHIGLFVNLFSTRPVPDSAIGWLLSHPDIAVQMGLDHTRASIYKGIFVQSPFLLFSLTGWLLSPGRRLTLLLPAAVVIPWLLLMSASTIFYGPSTADGRLILPLVPTLALGLGFFLDRQMHATSRVRVASLWLLGTAGAVSVYFAWESSATNFGPNISGPRWSLQQIMGPYGVMLDRVGEAFKQTFPNIYNLPVMLVLGVVLYLGAYATYQLTSRRLDAIPLPRELVCDPNALRAGTGEMAPAAPTQPKVTRRPALYIGVAGAASLAALLVLGVLVPLATGGTPRPAPPRSETGAVTTPALEPDSVEFAQVPSGLSVAERNAMRLADLPRIQAALEAYAASNGSYPLARSMQSLCRFVLLDAGCSLAPLLTPFPVDPAGGDTSYAYQSDGESYVLTTIWEGTSSPPEQFACPPDFRRSAPMLCLSQ